jgi:flagellar biosynthesis protein FlhB
MLGLSLSNTFLPLFAFIVIFLVSILMLILIYKIIAWLTKMQFLFFPEKIHPNLSSLIKLQKLLVATNSPREDLKTLLSAKK